MKTSQVPAFGCNHDLQCFETARAAALLPYTYSGDHPGHFLYHNHILTPAAIILVPTEDAKASGKKNVKERKKERCKYDVKVAPTPLQPSTKNKAKGVDEDLYKIPPHDLLYAQTRKQKKKVFGWFTSCVLPTCM